MTEEKKKGWFQKFKNVILGDEKETISFPAEPPKETLAESPVSNEDHSQPSVFLKKTEEQLVKDSLQHIDTIAEVIPSIPETSVLTQSPAETKYGPEPALIKTEEELVRESLQTEELKSVEEEPVKSIGTPLPKAEPMLNVKLEIGKGKIPFQKEAEKQELSELPVELNDPSQASLPKKKLGTSELMLDLRSQETPLDKEITTEEAPKPQVAWLPPIIDTEPEPEKKTELTPVLQKEQINVNPEEINNTEISSENEESNIAADPETGKKKSWFTKVVNTLNAPIEFKIQTPEGDDSFIAKLKGNVSIGLGKPVIERTDEDLEKWRENLRLKLSLTRESFTARLERLMHGRTKIDEELLEEIEEILLESDVGVDMTDAICNKLRSLAKEKRFLPSEVMPSLFDYLKDQLDAESQRIIVDDTRLNIIMMVGVNGTGKTTTTGKIAAKLRISDYSVILAAADTFRAAAIDQLDVWSQRAQVPLVKHQENSDPAAVVYDAIKAAKARNTNVLLIDTAGRLHNKTHLMEELRKIRRIIDREAPEAKLEVLLVLDGTTGQNGLKQAMVFGEAVQLTGVVLTKLDGTAKGGVIFSIKNTLKLPIKLVGVGEGIEDLRDFEPQIFIDALFSEKYDEPIEESTKMMTRQERN